LRIHRGGKNGGWYPQNKLPTMFHLCSSLGRRDLYTVTTIITFLREYKENDYVMYMQSALEQKADLIRQADSSSIFKYFGFDESMLKPPIKHSNNNCEDTVNLEAAAATAASELSGTDAQNSMCFDGFQHIESELKSGPLYKSYLAQSVENIQEKYSTEDANGDVTLMPESDAKALLDKLMKLIKEANISLEKIQFNGFKAGGQNRQKFILEINKQLVEKCLENPDIFDECKIIENAAAVDDISCMAKNNKQLNNLCNFLNTFSASSVKRCVKKLEACKGEKTVSGFKAPEISLEVADSFDKIRPILKEEIAERSRIKEEKKESLCVFIGSGPSTVTYVISTSDYKVLKIASRFFNDVEFDNFSFRGWKPALAWAIRDNMDQLIKQPVKFYLDDPGHPFKNCTKRGDPNFVTGLERIEHTLAMISSDENPANGIVLKISTQEKVFRKQQIMDILTILTSKLCTGMQEQIRYTKDALKTQRSEARKLRMAQAEAAAAAAASAQN